MSLQQSRRIKQKIQLDNRLKPYKNVYTDSYKMFRHKSSTVRLADKIYTTPRTPIKKKKNKQKRSNTQSPLQNKKLNSSQKRITSSHSSSSMSGSKIMMQGLQDRTLYLSELVSKNSDLIVQKKELQQKIVYYKQRIAYQNRKINQSEQKFKKYQAQLQQFSHRIYKTRRNISQVIQNQQKQKEQISILNRQIDRKTQQNTITKANIQKIKSINKNLKKLVKSQHNQIRQVSQHSSGYKSLLRQSQKKLMCGMVHKEQLANNRANLMIEANQITKRIEHLARF